MSSQPQTEKLKAGFSGYKRNGQVRGGRDPGSLRDPRNGIRKDTRRNGTLPGRRGIANISFSASTPGTSRGPLHLKGLRQWRRSQSVNTHKLKKLTFTLCNLNSGKSFFIFGGWVVGRVMPVGSKSKHGTSLLFCHFKSFCVPCMEEIHFSGYRKSFLKLSCQSPAVRA